MADLRFYYNNVDMTGAEAAKFLADTTRVTTIDPKSGYQNTTDANYLKSDVKEYTVVNDVTAAAGAGEVVVEFAVEDEDSGFVAGYQPAGALGDTAAEADTPALIEESPAETVSYADEEVYEYAVLVNRYKTADGKIWRSMCPTGSSIMSCVTMYRKRRKVSPTTTMNIWSTRTFMM